jgi:hypothetical protein
MRNRQVRQLLCASVALSLAVFVLSASAPPTSPGGPSAAQAAEEIYWAWSADGPCYRDSWCSRYYPRVYYRNVGCDRNFSGIVGVKFIRTSDWHDLYRYLSGGCADTGVVPSGTCRWALVANGGTYEWQDLVGDGFHYGGC